MRRRSFLGLIGGAAALPLKVRAQPARPIIGLLLHGVPSRITHFVAAFHQGLNETGYVEGRNVEVEYRYAEGRPERLPLLAAELVRLGVAVIAAGPVAERSAKSATKTIPIVFMTAQDPVRGGLVASMNRPGGNLTGATVISANLEAKRIGLLRALVPRADAIAVLLDPTASHAGALADEMRSTERTIGTPIKLVNAAGEADFDTAYAIIARTSAVLVSGSLAFLNKRERLVALAARYRIPAIYFAREFAEAGGLMSYSGSAIEAWQHVGRYTGRILKGEKAGDLPVVQATKFELVINLKTAKTLGLDIPTVLLATADEVIE